MRTSGRVKRRVTPRPTSPFAQIRPPLRRTILSTMAKPMPARAFELGLAAQSAQRLEEAMRRTHIKAWAVVPNEEEVRGNRREAPTSTCAEVAFA